MKQYLQSSIGKKQIVAITGLALVLFLIAHLSGNLLFFKGPEAINNYSKFLKDLGAGLWIARLGLIGAFVLHVAFIIILTIQNKKARSYSYLKPLHPKTRKLTTQLMRLSGLFLFVYVGVHLYDFTFTPHTDLNSTIDGEYLGLYGHMVTYLKSPIRSIFYILAMISVSLHLAHGVHSVVQTMGFNHPRYTPLAKKTANVISLLLGLGFSSVPIYILFFL
ncbi:succinate:quinone oxidoreductase [Candidatus Marinamargulisbacteria bacterium SCGC AG-410-N11]|nr:succinate:quinone oxidoreductase [Candidatus Marinamargulisbacteria bacterium SCGC AG-410-N11]